MGVRVVRHAGLRAIPRPGSYGNRMRPGSDLMCIGCECPYIENVETNPASEACTDGGCPCHFGEPTAGDTDG